MKTIDPKAEFLRGNVAPLFVEMTGNPTLRTALETALMQFVMDQLRQDTFEAATKQQYELQGAKKFISIFLNLTEVDQPKAPVSTGNLQWHPTPAPSISPAPEQTRPQPRKSQSGK